MTARIAVIDDEAPNRSYLQTALSSAGYDVDVAASGNEGLPWSRRAGPTL